MARETLVEWVDDLDGSAATQTVRFALDDADYELDLNGQHAAQLRDALARYIRSARRSTRARPATAGAERRSTVDYDAKAVRAWAASRKIKLSARGRIPATVLDQFRSAGY